jgi:four helix bundle protein
MPMATISRFEDIKSWAMARELTKSIYALTNRGAFAKDFGLKDQIRRAAVSIMSNIAEGYERDGNGEFVHFLSIAKGSSGEVRSQLYVAFDQNYVSEEEFNGLYDLATRTSMTLSGFISYLVEHPSKGPKYSAQSPKCDANA